MTECWLAIIVQFIISYKLKAKTFVWSFFLTIIWSTDRMVEPDMAC